TQSIIATLDILEGDPRELALALSGGGEIRQVTGKDLQDWSVRQETNGTRTLVLRRPKTDKPVTKLIVNIIAERELKNGTGVLTPLTLTPAQPALLSGYIRIESTSELLVQPGDVAGLIPIDLKF